MKPVSFPMLAPLSVLYGATMRTRLQLYQCGWLRTSSLAAPVISIGNITTGGTGKTPLVERVACVLATEGRRVCVLTRGYGRANPNHRVLVSDGQQVLANANDAGDEPRLLAENLRGLAAVISDADRFAAGTWAIKELGSDVFILDDGFQYLRLARALNIAVIDATQPWGGGHLLPWGRLREPLRGLSRADCVVITRAEQTAHVDSLREEIRQLSQDKPIFTSRMRLRGLRNLNDNLPADQPLNREDTRQPVAAFCGIGNPASFFRLLENNRYELAKTTILPDHHHYDQDDASELVRTAKQAGATCLITTAKDAVKLHGLCLDLPCHVLNIEIEIEDAARFVEMIRSAV